MRKALLIGSALTALLGAPVLAASAWADTATTTTQAQAQTQIDAESLIGLDVVNAEGETIGEVDNVVIDGQGQVRHVIVGVGGFLGIGEKNVALSWDQLVVASDGASATVPFTRDQLAGLPSHAYPDEVEAGTVYGYDDDVRVNQYLEANAADAAETKQAAAETVQETEQAAEEQAEQGAAGTTAGTTTSDTMTSDTTGTQLADTTAGSATDQAQATVTTEAARIEASSLLGADVETAAGDSVGDVDEIWLDANGQVAGLVVDVGGYLGIGSDPVLLAWSDLQIRQDGDDVVAVTALSREQIEALTSIQNSAN